MADFTPKFVDLVKNYVTTTGTGDFTLGTAVNGFTGFANALLVGDRFYYSCIGIDKPAEREVGRGTLLSGGKIAREPISGAKTSFTTGNKSIALIAAAEWFDGVADSVAGATSAAEAANAAAASATDALAGVQSDIGTLEIQVASLDSELDGTVTDLAALEATVAGMSGGESTSVASRAALTALSAQAGQFRDLVEAGREGTFKFSAANLSAFVAADPLQGIYVAPASDPSGANGAWVRQGERLTPFMFGGQTNYKSGNRGTMVPPYGESATPGSTDGILVDSRAACQAVLDMVRLHEHREFVADFSGGLWGIAKRNDGGAFAEDGLVINQAGEHPRTFIGGEFRGIGGGRYLIHVDEAGNSLFEGRWHIRSGADLGSSYGYPARQWETGIWLRNSSMCRWELVRISGFARWGVEYDPEYSEADYNNNIGARFERAYVNHCGSAVDRPGDLFTVAWTASSRSGSAFGVAQRTNLTLAAGHEILRVGDIIRSPEGSYHYIAEKAGAVVSLYPWMVSQAATGTLTSAHGGGMRVRGKDVAGAGADHLTGLRCGVALDISNALHGTEWGNVIQEGGGIGTLVGTLNGVNLGHTIGHMHSEAVTLDLISIGAAQVELMIGACSAWAAQDYSDPFKLTEVIGANDGTKLETHGLPQVVIPIGGQWWGSGVTLGGDGVSTKSRSYIPAFSNNPNSNRVRKVQSPGAPTSITLKYYERTDRALRDSFVATLEVVGAGGLAPADTITVTLDANDVANGIEFANGTTASTYVVSGGSATGPVLLDFWLDTSGSTLRWIVIPRTGLADAIDSIVGISGTLAEFNAAITDANIPQVSTDLGDGADLYRAGGTDVALADGGTGASLADPGADRLMFWDDSAGQVTWLSLGANLSITGTVLDAASGGGGGGVSDGDKGDVVVSASGATWTVESAAGNFVTAGDLSVDGGDATITKASGNPSLNLVSISAGTTGSVMQNGSYVILKSTGGLVGFESNTTQIAQFAEAGNWIRTYLQILSPESDPYGAGWNGSSKVPTKDEIYDKLEGTLTPASIAAAGSITTSGGKVGYAIGSGGTVTQSPNKSSAVTLHKLCGEITMSGGALAANTAVTFTLTNNTIEAGDRIIVNHKSGGTFGAYVCDARAAAGSATVMLRNVTGGSLNEAVVLGFAVVKAVTA